MKYIPLIFLLSINLCSCAQKTTAKTWEELSIVEIDSIFDNVNRVFKENEMTRYLDEVCKKLNGSVLIVRDDQLLYKKTTGYKRLYDKKGDYEKWTLAELESARKSPANVLQANTPFELASISKQFTAVAVLKLVEEKKIKLTDSLQRFYPELPYPNVTIHQLLSHTSGLPEYIDFPDSYFDTTHLLTNQELVTILADHKEPVQFNPAEAYKYTNTNYVLLAAIIEKVADIRFEDFIREKIFVPAGMTHTFFVTDIEERGDKNISKGHLGSRKEVPRYYMDGTVGDKGIYSTTEDLLKWKKALFNDKKMIAPELLKKATSKQNFIKGKGVAKEIYGYGFRIEENPDLGKLIYHGGLWRGYQHVMVYRESDNCFIVFLSNFRNRAHVGKSNEILHIIDGA